MVRENLVKTLMHGKPLKEQLATSEYLVSVVQRFRSIYDPNHKEFQNIAYNNVIWREIERETGISRPNKVFCNLKITFKRMKERLADGKELDPKRRVFFDMMQICDDPNHVLKEPYVPPVTLIKPRMGSSLPEASGVKLTKKERKKREMMLKAAKKEETKKLNELVFRMLKEVEKYPCLYNLENVDRQTSKQAWEKIVAKTGVLDARKRFSNLRSTYKRVKFRTHPERRSKFVFYDALKFIDSKLLQMEEGGGECDSRNNTYWSDSDDSFLWKDPAIPASTTNGGVGGEKQEGKDSETTAGGAEDDSRYSEGSQSVVKEGTDQRREMTEQGTDDGPPPLIDEWPSIIEMRETLKTDEEKRMFSMWLMESAQECMDYIQSLR